MENTTPIESAWNEALRKLSRRERTSQEIREFLESRRYEMEVIQQTITLLVEKRYLDDRRYAEAFTRLQGSRGKGPNVIRRKLKLKGLDLSDLEISEIIEAAQGKTELERAREIVERRYPEFREDLRIAQKAYQALIRRGFSFSIAREATRRKS